MRRVKWVFLMLLVGCTSVCFGQIDPGCPPQCPGGTGCPPQCVPIDDYLWVVLLAGVLLIGYKGFMNTKRERRTA